MSVRLIIDTAMRGMTVAIFDGETPLFVHEEALMQGQQERIGGIVYQALETTKLNIIDCDAVAVTLGPGSFTGLRVGLSFAKGLAFGAQKPLLGLSNLKALCFHANTTADKVMAVHDAGRDQFYVQTRHLDTLSDAQILSTEAFLEFATTAPKDHQFVGQSFGALETDNQQLIFAHGPDVAGLNALCQRGLHEPDLTPLYMRPADASVSQKPVLQL